PSPSERPGVCEETGHTDCRNMFSMSTQVMLHRLPSGKDILLAGQKWGYMYGLDPDNNGAVIWKTKVSRGGDLGGVMYGFSADQHALYVSISDIDYGADESKATVQPGGLVALQIATGEILWKRPPVTAQCSCGEISCSSAQVSATTTVPGAVFSGA